jgi:hypothetical protein
VVPGFLLVACASSAGSGPTSELDVWRGEIRESFVDGRAWVPDTVTVERVRSVELLTWRRTQQAYCVTEALLWLELELAEGMTAYALVRAMRWPPDGGAFGEDHHAWAPSASPYGEVDALRVVSGTPTNRTASEIWPSALFGAGEGFPVVQGEVRASTWRRLLGEEPPVLEYTIDSSGSEDCAGS